MALLDTTDSNDALGRIADLVNLVESQAWGVDEPGYNEALSLLDALKRQIIILTNEGEDDPAEDAG